MRLPSIYLNCMPLVFFPSQVVSIHLKYVFSIYFQNFHSSMAPEASAWKRSSSVLPLGIETVVVKVMLIAITVAVAVLVVTSRSSY